MDVYVTFNNLVMKLKRKVTTGQLFTGYSDLPGLNNLLL
jgi:hypothetical protein